mmetsp:Transcript_21902/g.53307  ORF Transcript_21902/g.53307 Transcript_21902/m.53307 type:complete len:317 (+) Transcript_21902:963-1913(+)
MFEACPHLIQRQRSIPIHINVFHGGTCLFPRQPQRFHLLQPLLCVYPTTAVCVKTLEHSVDGLRTLAVDEVPQVGQQVKRWVCEIAGHHRSRPCSALSSLRPNALPSVAVFPEVCFGSLARILQGLHRIGWCNDDRIHGLVRSYNNLIACHIFQSVSIHCEIQCLIRMVVKNNLPTQGQGLAQAHWVSKTHEPVVSVPPPRPARWHVAPRGLRAWDEPQSFRLTHNAQGPDTQAPLGDRGHQLFLIHIPRQPVHTSTIQRSHHRLGRRRRRACGAVPGCGEQLLGAANHHAGRLHGHGYVVWRGVLHSRLRSGLVG